MPSSNSPASFPVAAGPATDDTLKIGGDPSPEPPKYFFLEECAKLSVKGNMIPLAATPTFVDSAEWFAHQSRHEHHCE